MHVDDENPLVRIRLLIRMGHVGQEPSRPEGLAPANPSDATLPHPEPPVQAARRRATPCCAPLRQAAVIAASEQRPPAGDDAPECFQG